MKVLSSSTSDLSQFGSLDRGRTRKTSKSSCDVRVDNDGERVYIAKVKGVLIASFQFMKEFLYSVPGELW